MSINKLKNLPKNDKGEIEREFMANGHKYIIRGPEETFTFSRLNEYQKLSLMMQTGRNLQDLYSNYNKAISLCDKAGKGSGFAELSAYLFTQRKNVLELAESKYDAASLLCTLFIVRSDEDITKWSIKESEQKISDWSKANYSPFDFFLLAFQTSSQLKGTFKKMLQGKTREQIIESLPKSD